jgi:hypothetical protein
VGTAGAGGSYYFGNSGTKYLNYDGTQYSLVGGALYTGGNIYANGGWIAAGDAGSSATKGTYYFGGNLNKSLNYDGANFNLVGGSFIVNNATAWIGQGQPNATIYFGSTGTKYLSYDGTNFNLTGGALSVSGPVVASGVVTIANTGTGATNATLTLNGGSGGSGGALTQWLKNGTVKWYEGFRSSVYGGGSVSDNYMIFNVVASTPVFELDSATKTILLGNGTGYIPASACAVKVAASGGGIQYGIGIGVQADNTNLMVFSNSGNVNIGSISETAGAVAFNTSSSGELKEDLKSFDAGNIIDATDVYDFKWKKTGERAYGVIAQQAVEVYPMAVTHSQQDGQEDDFWGVDYSKYVPVLLQELKALRARVAQLEGRATAQPA